MNSSFYEPTPPKGWSLLSPNDSFSSGDVYWNEASERWVFEDPYTPQDPEVVDRWTLQQSLNEGGFDWVIRKCKYQDTVYTPNKDIIVTLHYILDSTISDMSRVLSHASHRELNDA